METITPENIFNEPQYMQEIDSNAMTPMKAFFKDKTVFLTGGTGFLGQLYVEKLLRCDAKHIYLLGRAKKGKNAEQRLKETFTGTLFLKLYDHDPDYMKRVSVVEGDMGKPNMGLSEAHLKLLTENVEIVIHAAADVRFDEKLLTLLMINLRGTRDILELTSKMKKIKAFTFISTAYSHCERQYVEEKFYEPPVEPSVMIKLGEIYNANPKEDLLVMTERIIQPWPNTYTYTKALTEELVRQYGAKVPICIIRPSIVISTFEDPIPAWCNNIYGLNGVLVAVGLGVLRLLQYGKGIVGDIVCADFVINSTLAALWVTHDEWNKKKLAPVEKADPEIYHVCTSVDRPVTWETIAESMGKTFEEHPAKGVLWKRCTTSVTSYFWFTYLTIFYHVIPAALSDIVLKLRGKTLRVLPVYRKAHRFIVALSYFMRRNWTFDNSNMKRVLAKMTPSDQKFFPSDVRRYHWHTFVYDYLMGLKLYIALESLDDVHVARKKYKRLVVLHYFVLAVYYGFHIVVLTYLADKLGIFQYVRNSAIDTYEFLKNPQLVQ